MFRQMAVGNILLWHSLSCRKWWGCFGNMTGQEQVLPIRNGLWQEQLCHQAGARGGSWWHTCWPLHSHFWAAHLQLSDVVPPVNTMEASCPWLQHGAGQRAAAVAAKGTCQQPGLCLQMLSELFQEKHWKKKIVFCSAVWEIISVGRSWHGVGAEWAGWISASWASSTSSSEQEHSCRCQLRSPKCPARSPCASLLLHRDSRRHFPAKDECCDHLQAKDAAEVN